RLVTYSYSLALHDALPICGSARIGLHPADWLDIDLFGKQQFSKKSLDTFVDDPNSLQKLRQNFGRVAATVRPFGDVWTSTLAFRSEEHTSELQSRENLVCR